MRLPSEQHRAREQLFLSLVDQHKNILYKISRSYCRTAEDRSDLTQEIIIQLWRSFDAYDEKRVWSTWMYRIALNVAISYYRKEAKRIPADSQLLEDVLALKYAGDDHQDASQDKIDFLYAFINKLKKFDKALMLLYLDDHGYQEIADILGITKTNVATKISRIKSSLKQHVSTDLQKQ